MKTGTRIVAITLPWEVSSKLDEYGFDYQRNMEEWCKDVYKEIVKCEDENKKRT